MIDQKLTKAFRKAIIEHGLDKCGVPKEVLDSLPPKLRKKLASKWLDPSKLWYAVPQQKLELRYATAEEMAEVMEMFRGWVKDDQHRASTASH